MSRRGCVAVFLSLCAGIAAGTFLQYTVFTAAVALSLFVFLILFERRTVPILAVLCLTVGLTLSDIGFREYRGSDSDCVFSGRVCAMDSDSFQLSDTVFFEHPELNGTSVRIYTYPAGIAFGDILSVRGNTVPYAFEDMNPGEYKGVLNACADNMSCKCYASEYSIVGHKGGADSLFARMRYAILGKLTQYSDDLESTSVMYAMLTGDKTFIDDDTSGAFSASGVSHLLAISGLHLSILLDAVCLLLVRFKRRSFFRFALIGVFVTFYAAFTGFSPSVVRATIMALLLAFASAVGMRYDLLSALCTAGIIMLTVNPYRLYDISFQLSFSAIFGIAVFGKSSVSHMHERLPFKELPFKSRIKACICTVRDSLEGSARVTVGATVSTMPTMLVSFGTVPALAVPVNLILIPIASLALTLLLVSVLISFVIPPLGILLRIPCSITELLLYFVHLAANIPVLPFAKPPIWFIPVALSVIYFFSRFCLVRNKIKRCCGVIIVLALCIVTVISQSVIRNTVTLEVLALNSDIPCVHVRCNGENYLINPDSENRTVTDYVSSNIGHAETVFLTDRKFDADNVYRLLPTDGDGILLKAGDSVNANGCLFTCVTGGMLIECRDVSVFVQTEAKPVQPPCDIAIGEDSSLTADTVITRNTDNTECNKLFITSHCGSVKIKIDKKIHLIPYRKVHQ